MSLLARVRESRSDLCGASIVFFVIFLLLGIGRNLPGELLYFRGVGLPEFLVLLMSLWLLRKRASRVSLFEEALNLRGVLIAGLFFVLFALASMVINASRYGVDPRDFFEIIRYGCYLALTVFSAYAARRFGVMPIVAFILGVLTTGVVAWFYPMNPNVNGLNVRMIFNPNVIGNVLAVATVMGSLIIVQRNAAIGMGLACLAALLSFFTFSKGTWIMETLGVMGCLLALVAGNNTGGKSERRWAAIFFVALILMVLGFHQIITQVVEAKIVATQFSATAVDGGSFSARCGLIASAYRMFLMDPLFGIGISNFETINQIIKPELGAFFYDDNTPNNVWLYILGCMGLPAFLCFLWIFFTCARLFSRVSIPLRPIRLAYTLCVMLVLFVGGNVQLEMITSLYFWVLIGFLAGFYLPKSATAPSFLKKL